MTNGDQSTGGTDQWPSILGTLRSPVAIIGLVILVLNAVLGSIVVRAERQQLAYLPWVLCGLLGLTMTIFAVIVLRRPDTIGEAATGGCGTPVDASMEWDVFVSSPMSSFTSEEEYEVHRREVRKVVDILRTTCEFPRVYWASERFPTMREFDKKNIALDKDKLALLRSVRFLLIYPMSIPSSVLVEAGMALAWEKPAVYWCNETASLPFMLDQAGQVRSARVNVYRYSTVDDIVKHFRSYKGAAFDIT